MIKQQTNTSLVADELLIDNTNVIGSRLGRIDPSIFSNRRKVTLEDGNADDTGKATGEYDHHQDDN